jgi:flagellum-specific peptidoglycan hydrolase FlgJ
MRMLLAILLAMLMFDYIESKMTKEETSHMDAPLTGNTVFRHLQILESYGIKHAWVVMAQECHETGWFSSPVYREGFNRFGMKVSSRSFHIGQHRGHAKYRSHEDSIKDYKAWQDRRLQLNSWVKTDDDYIRMLMKVGYAEDPDYDQKLYKTLNLLRELAALPE